MSITKILFVGSSGQFSNKYNTANKTYHKGRQYDVTPEELALIISKCGDKSIELVKNNSLVTSNDTIPKRKNISTEVIENKNDEKENKKIDNPYNINKDKIKRKRRTLR